jgi:ribosomal protein S18 acetylase RimI-like enzyme
MRIRPYNSPDRQDICDILETSRTFTAEEVGIALSVIDDAQKCPDEYVVLCAENDQGDVVGYICYGPIPMTDRCYDLYWICVNRARKKKGIGTALVLSMESDIQQRRARHVYIDTSSTPPYDEARSFYERHGYRVLSVSPDFYREGDDKVVYRKVF